jgi:Zincin-like metallopeptidase
MPSRTAFESQAEYYSTLFHELTHATGHAKRRAREGFVTPLKFGGESYSREELIAKMGSAMLCGVAGIEQATLANSAAYLKSWIARLKADSKLVVSAASAAQKAAAYIRGESVKAPRHGGVVPCKLTSRSRSPWRRSTGPSASRISSARSVPRRCCPRSASWRVAVCRSVWSRQEHDGSRAHRRTTSRVAQDS